MKKLIGLTAIAGLALTLSACDLFKSKASEPPVNNEQVSNEDVFANSEDGFEDNVSSAATGNATETVASNTSTPGNPQ